MNTGIINRIAKSIFIGLCVCLVLTRCETDELVDRPFDLTISEGFENPIGFYDSIPTFSWKLPQGTKRQSAYEILVASSPDLLPERADLWSSGKVESGQSTFIKYDGTKLGSKQKVYWQVKFWDEEGIPSQWSEVAFFELGLLINDDWKAQWISFPNQKATHIEEIDKKVHRIQHFRKTVALEKDVRKARLYISAKGLFEAQINGNKVGEAVLAPGWTPYEKRIETLTFDVGHLLQKGENAIGLELAEGWYSGRLIVRGYGKDSPKIIAQLEIEYADKTSDIFVTDQSWKTTNNGPIRYSSIYDGEFYDANFEMSQWSTPGFNDSKWVPVVTQAISDTVQLSPKRHNLVVNKIELPTQTITEPVKGRVVFDLGQNMAGVPRINIPVKKGQKVTVRFAEMLKRNGEIYTENYRRAVSTDFYIPAQDGEITWEPKFTFHGFRYVELSGFDQSIKPEKSWVTGLVQHSDFEFSGTFQSSHSKLNQLQSNIEWGLRSNFLDIPTDCPQRDERLGWTGDAQVFLPTSMFIADVHSFWASWLQSLREEQRVDGSVPNVIPDVWTKQSSSGWGDAATIVPRETYWRTGDVRILEDSYASMLEWVDFYQSKSQGHIVEMFTFGDWLQPYSQNPKDTRFGETDDQLINTAYYARSVEICLNTAKVLGKTDEVDKLQSWHNEIKTAFQNQFFNADGSVSRGKPTQTAYLLALGFNLLSPDMEKKVIPHLMAEIEKADTHLGTGFLGTPLLAPVLDKLGRADLMFEMLFKETYPSWFYSINQGATTMWERWDSYTHKDGFNPGGMNSFNHYAYGAIGQWMYERIAGISPKKAGYKEIRIAPLPGGPLTSVQATYDSPYGNISSAWSLEGNTFTLKTTVPPNTTAKIIIPADTEEPLLLEGMPFENNPNISLIEKADDAFELLAQPGSYQFEAILKSDNPK